MFGSKKSKTTSKVDVSINTMDDDVKGVGAKNVSVEYNKSNPTDGTGQKQQTTPATGGDTNTSKTSQTAGSVAGQPVGESPFKNESAKPSKEPQVPHAPNSSQGTSSQSPHGLPTGTFSMPDSSTPEKNIPSFSTNPTLDSKTDSSSEKPFLHQATDKIDNSVTNTLKTNKSQKNISKKSGISSIIWVIAFILLLGTILLGVYYFYMKKDNKTNFPTNKGKQTTPKKTTNISKTNNKPTGTNKIDSQTGQQTKAQTNSTTGAKPTKTTAVQSKLPTSFKTSETTFIDDLGRFLLTLKNSNNEKIIRGGVIITPMIDNNKPLSAQELIKSMGMTNLFKETDLKPACKLFIMKDADKMRTALVFELANGVDDKVVKENIIKNENSLPEIMKSLFVNEAPPTVPPTIKFSVNKDNLNSRYFNYKPGDTFTSNDWNILDLGQGKILYFATSKNLAEKITNYFMNLVVK